MAAKDIKEFVDLRDDIEVRISRLNAILERDEVEVKLVSTSMEMENYSITLPKEDFVATLEAQRDRLAADLADMDAKLKKWTGELKAEK